MGTYSIDVKGRPVGYSNSGEKEWRRQIILAVRKNLARPFETPKSTVFTVKLDFRLSAARCFYKDRNDLDNMIKPVTDTLFKTRSKKYTTGVLFEVDDTFVNKIIAEKRVDENEGATITVTW